MPTAPDSRGAAGRIWTADAIALEALGHGVNLVWLNKVLRNYFWIRPTRGGAILVVTSPVLPPEAEVEEASPYLIGASAVGWGRFMQGRRILPWSEMAGYPSALFVQGEARSDAAAYAAPFLREGRVVRMRVPIRLATACLWGRILRR